MTGQWNKLEAENIDRFMAQLNLKGVRERNLFNKISEYRRMGFLTSYQGDFSSDSSESVASVVEEHMQQDEEVHRTFEEIQLGEPEEY